MRNLLIAILVLLVHFSYADAFYLDNESIYASTVNIGYFPNLGNSVSYESFKTQIGATYAVWTNVDIGSLFTYLYNNVSSVKSNNYTIQLDVVYNFAQFGNLKFKSIAGFNFTYSSADFSALAPELGIMLNNMPILNDIQIIWTIYTSGYNVNLFLGNRFFLGSRLALNCGVSMFLFKGDGYATEVFPVNIMLGLDKYFE